MTERSWSVAENPSRSDHAKPIDGCKSGANFLKKIIARNCSASYRTRVSYMRGKFLALDDDKHRAGRRDGDPSRLRKRTG